MSSIDDQKSLDVVGEHYNRTIQISKTCYHLRYLDHHCAPGKFGLCVACAELFDHKVKKSKKQSVDKDIQSDIISLSVKVGITLVSCTN